MSRTSCRAAALVVALGALLLVGAGPAPAAPAPPDGGHAGLVRATLAANPGSVRVSTNEIQLEPGLVMTLRGKGDPATTRQARGIRCNYLYFCLYEHANWRGAALGMSACKVYILSSYVFWNGTEHQWDDWALDASSWINNQSGGVRATLWKSDGLRSWLPVAKDDHMIPGWNDAPVKAKPC
jgi:hypothetical protein